jgi:hypothetical protein
VASLGKLQVPVISTSSHSAITQLHHKKADPPGEHYDVSKAWLLGRLQCLEKREMVLVV